jgi:hypothetical protein
MPPFLADGSFCFNHVCSRPRLRTVHGAEPAPGIYSEWRSSLRVVELAKLRI